MTDDIPRKPPSQPKFRKRKLIPHTAEEKKRLGIKDDEPKVPPSERLPIDLPGVPPTEPSEDADEVGYGKPPKKHQFKKGQSGNPKGRPKGPRNIKTDLAEELSETLTVRENGKSRKITKRRAMIKSAMAKALKGDPRTTKLILDMIGSTGLDANASDTPGSHDLSALDREILEAFAERMDKQEGQNEQQ